MFGCISNTCKDVFVSKIYNMLAVHGRAVMRCAFILENALKPLKFHFLEPPVEKVSAMIMNIYTDFQHSA